MQGEYTRQLADAWKRGRTLGRLQGAVVVGIIALLVWIF